MRNAGPDESETGLGSVWNQELLSCAHNPYGWVRIAGSCTRNEMKPEFVFPRSFRCYDRAGRRHAWRKQMYLPSLA